MRCISRRAAMYAVPALVFCTLLKVPVGAFASNAPTSANSGREIAFDTQKGNCLACHMIPGGVAPGNIGPPLIAMKSRYTDREMIKRFLWDPEAFKPGITMPPFGKNGILSGMEIEQLVDFIWTL
jgi:L-cysteine S-thiosulfotransferase